MADLFTIRDAEERDMAYVQAYAYAEGMDPLEGPEHIRVAVNSEDIPVGFIHVDTATDGIAYVHPIVTCASWRGYGVASALLDEALSTYGELRLVARGYNEGFYGRLGFEKCSWEEIDASISADCEGCELREECGPIPFRRCYATAE